MLHFDQGYSSHLPVYDYDYQNSLFKIPVTVADKLSCMRISADLGSNTGTKWFVMDLEKSKT